MATPDIYLGPPKSEPIVNKPVEDVDPIRYIVAGAYPELAENESLFNYAVTLAAEGMNDPVSKA